MRRLWLMISLLMGLALVVAAPGCGSGYRQSHPPEAIEGFETGGGGVAKATEELASDGWATIEGTISYDGPDLPEGATVNINKDEKICKCDAAIMRGEDKDQIWLGKKSGDRVGVGNVVIYLRAPDGKHFKIFDKYKDVSQDKDLGRIVLDQPFCAYEPRVVVLYPGYSNGKELIASGQVFEVRNSATIAHNTNIKCNPAVQSDYTSGTISAGDARNPGPVLKPQESPMRLGCDIHPWMTGWSWSFNHPYAARTDLEGKFKIANVPAGAEVTVVIWHEGVGFYKGDGFEGQRGKKMTFTKDQTAKLDLKIKKG